MLNRPEQQARVWCGGALGPKMIGAVLASASSPLMSRAKPHHISKRDGKYFAVTMDYTRIDTEKHAGLDAKNPVKLDLRELTADEPRRRWPHG